MRNEGLDEQTRKAREGAKAEPTGGAVRTAAAFTTSAHVEPAYSGGERRRTTGKKQNKTGQKAIELEIQICQNAPCFQDFLLFLFFFEYFLASKRQREPSNENGHLGKLVVRC